MSLLIPIGLTYTWQYYIGEDYIIQTLVIMVLRIIMYFHFLHPNAAACEATKTKQWVLRASAFKSKILLSMFHIKHSGISLTVQWLGLSTFTAMATVQFLVRGLKSCKPCTWQNKNRDSMLLLWNSWWWWIHAMHANICSSGTHTTVRILFLFQK